MQGVFGAAMSQSRRSVLRAVLLFCLLHHGVLWADSITASSSTCQSATGIGTQSWSNAARVVASDDSYATASVNDGQVTNWLQCTGYGFSLPSHANISGIAVDIERQVSNTNGADAAVRLVKGGVIGVTDRSDAANYPIGSDGTVAHGGSNDLWGTTWTPANINASNFGVAFAAKKNGTSGNARTLYIDYIRITVSYTLPTRSCVSVANGNWNTAATWNCGAGPGDGPPLYPDNVTINGHTVSVDTSPTVASLTNNSGTLQQSGAVVRSLTVSGAFNNNGTVVDNGGSGSFDLVIGGALTNNGTAFTADNLSVGGATTNNAALTVRSGFVAGGDVTSNNSASFTVANLTFQKSGTQAATFYGSANSVGNFTVNSGTTVSSTNYSSLNLTGTLTNNGTLTLPNTTWTFNGSSAQSVAGTSDSALGNMVLNNAAGLTLNRNVTVAGSLTLTSGKVSTGNYFLDASGTVCPTGLNGGSASSYVIGNLRLRFPNYGATCIYPVGDPSVYAPITVTFPWFAGITGGTLTGSTVGGQHPQIGTSGINSLADVKRYWVLGAAGDTLTSLPVGGSYNATFQFVSNDIIGGALVENFAASRYTSAAWTVPVISLSGYTSNTASVNGMTAFGSYVVGQPGAANPGQCSVPSFVPAGVTCYCDSFTGSNMASGIFNSKWTVSTLGPTAFTPAFVSGRLRLTDNNNNEATSATLGAIFPAAGNYISVEFRQFAYNSTTNPGADGIAVTLSDYAVSPNPGAFGGSLGYAQKTGIVGFAGGWLGVGFDEYGNYTNPTEGRIDGPGFLAQVVGVRGSYVTGGTLYSQGYPYLAKSVVQTGSNTIDNRTSTVASRGYYYQVVIDARNYTPANKTALIQVNRDNSCSTDFCPTTGYTNLLSPFDAYAPGFTPTTTQVAVPDYWQLSFTGSTGGSTNIHEIGGLRVCAQTIVPPSGTVASGFNAIDSALSNTPINVQQAGAHIYTKLVGTDFRLNIAVLNSTATAVDTTYAATSNKNVTVELIDNSTSSNQSTACSAKTGVIGAPLSMTFSATDKGFKLSPIFNVASAYQNVIVRIKDGTTTGCSTDSFAIRPSSLTSVTAKSGTTTLVASSNGVSTTTTVAAGANFTLTTTASPAANYNGTPSIATTKVTDFVSGNTSAPLSCAFGMGDTSTGVARATCQYNEVGYFSLAADAVIDSSFTLVDQAKGDCLGNSSSNTIDSNGKYGCNIGSPTATSWGRFIPDHFALSAVALTNRNELGSCSSRNTDGYTYMGEPLGVAFSLTARAAGGSTTANYDFAKGYSRLTVGNWLTGGGGAPLDSNSLNLWGLDNPASPATKTTFASGTGTRFAFTGTAASANCTGTPVNRWCAGVANFSGALTLSRAAAPDGPFNSFALGIAPRDLDSVVLQGSALNLDVDQDASHASERANLGATSMRFGLLQLTTAYGSELLPLAVRTEARYWNGTAFILNGQDNCTAIQADNVAAARVSGVSSATLASPSVTAISAGRGGLRFATPGVRSTFRICVDAGSDANCAATTTANLGYLTGRWDGSASYDRDPSARAAFGLNRGAYLYYRENY